MLKRSAFNFKLNHVLIKSALESNFRNSVRGLDQLDPLYQSIAKIIPRENLHEACVHLYFSVCVGMRH